MESSNPLSGLNARDLVVDFLGSLVPGIVFTGIAFVLFSVILFNMTEIVFLLTSDAVTKIDILSFVQSMHAIMSPFRIEFIIFFIILSYVLGHIFYRQDLKYPDKASFRRIRLQFEKDSQLAQLDGWVAKTEEEVEYPYLNFRRYLESRGLDHLCPLVLWGKDRGETHTMKRTKFFVGILKIRLYYYRPEKCGAIARNEAHIRLSSTAWHLAKTIRKICYLALVTSVIAFGCAFFVDRVFTYPENLNFLLPIILAVSILVIMLRLIAAIENFFHYQRVREVVFVLETAYAFLREEPTQFADIFPDLAKKFRAKSRREKIVTI